MSSITSAKNPLVKHLCKLRANPVYRKKNNTVLICGSKMVAEVCPKTTTPNLLMKSGEKPPPGVSASATYYAPPTILQKIANMPSVDKMVAEVAMPKLDYTVESLANRKLVLVLDRISDPGNMGTLIRSAFNFEWDGVCILGNSVDPFNHKALQSAKGFTFSTKITMLKNWDELKKYIKEKKVLAFVADVDSKEGMTNFRNISKFSQPKIPPNLSVDRAARAYRNQKDYQHSKFRNRNLLVVWA